MLFSKHLTSAFLLALGVSGLEDKKTTKTTGTHTHTTVAPSASVTLSAGAYVSNLNTLDGYAKQLEKDALKVTTKNAAKYGQVLVTDLSVIASAAAQYAADAQTGAEQYSEEAEQKIGDAYVTFSKDLKKGVKTVAGLKKTLTAFAAPLAASLSALQSSLGTLATVVESDVGAEASSVVTAATSLNQSISAAISAYGGGGIGIGI